MPYFSVYVDVDKNCKCYYIAVMWIAYLNYLNGLNRFRFSALNI